MAIIKTLGDAYAAKWSIRMRCLRGHHRGIVKIDPWKFEVDLSLETLVCTRGRRFPQLASHLQCPNCGKTNLELLFDVPGSALPVFVPQSLYRRQA